MMILIATLLLRDDPTKFKVQATIPDHEIEVTALAWSPDGQALVTGDADGLLYVWKPDGSPLKRKLTRHHKGAIRAIAFSSGENFAVLDSEGVVRTWEKTSWSMVRKPVTWHKTVTALAGSPKAILGVCGDDQGQGSVWDFVNGSKGGEFKHPASIAVVAAHDAVFASIDSLGTIVVWDFPQVKELWRVEKAHEKPATAAKWLSAGVLITADEGGGVCVWEQGKKKASFTHEKGVKVLATDGTWIATGGGDGRIVIWTAEGKAAKEFEGHRGGVNGLAFSPDGKRLASCGEDQIVKIWGE